MPEKPVPRKLARLDAVQDRVTTSKLIYTVMAAPLDPVAVKFELAIAERVLAQLRPALVELHAEVLAVIDADPWPPVADLAAVAVKVQDATRRLRDSVPEPWPSRLKSLDARIQRVLEPSR